MKLMQQHSAAPVDAPSPLVGEGYTAIHHELTAVRGFSPHTRMRREPLTRLREACHRAALRADPLAKPPSPTRGEGKRAA
ncbi:hypothetical protein V1292_003691 [Bradyrhizobium sp. AZCC 1719]